MTSFWSHSPKHGFPGSLWPAPAPRCLQTFFIDGVFKWNSAHRIRCFIVSCWSLRLCNVWGSSRGLNFNQSWRWCVMSQTIAHEAQMNVNAQTLFFPLEWQPLPENKKQSKTKQTCRSNKCANISLCLGPKWLPEPWFAWRWTIGWTTDPANPCTVFMGVDNGVDNGVS